MKLRLHATAKRHRGFGLVEVMVAMVIGMLGIIIMLQVFAVAEGQKRSTTGAGDAQNNGAMALYALQRDIRQAGYGFSSVNVLGCALALPSHTLAQLAPVVINPPVTDVPAGDANTDTLLVAYGSSAGSPEGDPVTSTPTTAGVMSVTSPTNFTVGDQVIAAPSAPLSACTNPTTPLRLAAVTAVTPLTVTLPASGAVEKGALFNLGSSPRILAYAVRSGNLTVCDYLAANCATACTAGNTNCNADWVPIASGIASLRAEYGHASSATSGVDVWDQTTPASACLWPRTMALRVAVIARNNQVDKDTLTGEVPSWEGSAGTAIDLSGKANWQNFRYKVFQTVIPIRNLPWMESCTP